MKKLEPLYTIAETAKILNVSEKTVRRLIEGELLRAINFRRGDCCRGPVRIAPADLEDLSVTIGVDNRPILSNA